MSRVVRTGVMLAAGLIGGLAAAVLVPSPIRWRAQVVALTLAGRIPDLPLSELPAIVTPGAPVWAEALATSRNPNRTLVAPDGPTDLAAGRGIFEAHCASCHGADGRAPAGGDLTSGQFRNGAGDWAVYRTVRAGIAGTPMGPSGLDPASAWRVTGYVRHLAAEANPYRADADPTAARPSVDVHDVTFTDLRQARASGEWLTFSGTYDGQRHSALTTIDRTTAERLRLAWMVQLPGGDEPLAVTPLVVGGTMFVNLPLGDVYAIDVLSGDVLWRTMRTDAPALTATAVEGRINQGMAVLGDTLFVTTLDAHLIALDIRTGARRWTVSVAEAQGGSGYAIVGAPLAVDGRIVVGVAGGDRGIRGFLAAYAPDDGRRLWRFETIPADGEDGHDTWGTTDGWRRGGGLTPITGSYDPETGLIYWGVGNPSPAFNGDARPGDNLYTSSLVAIDAASGQLRWHYQFVPHDEWEYGVTHVPVLSTDVSPGGQSSRLVQLASRNGFFYTLNRDTGAFLRATPFARQTWNDGFDAVGRPRIRPRARPVSGGTFTTPGHAGATSWWPPSYDASTGTFFVLTRDGYANTFYKDRRLTWPDGAFWGGRAAGVPGVAIVTEVRAIDAATGDLRWRYRFPGTVVGSAGGLLSTAGGIVFAGEKARFVALDARSGHELWNFHTGGIVVAAPVTYAREARQFVTIVAGRAVLTFSLTP